MARVYVDFSQLESVGSYCNTAAKKVSSINFNFAYTIAALDWDVKYESDISDTAAKISEKLSDYKTALKAYSQFIEDACEEYSKLNEYEVPEISIETTAGESESSESGLTIEGIENIPNVVGPGSVLDIDFSDFNFDLDDIIGSFGLFGQFYKWLKGLSDNSEWYEWISSGKGAWTLISKLASDISSYAKVGSIYGTGQTVSYFLRNFFGLNSTGYASQASSFSARFYNNLHNTTSPYSFSLSDAFSSFTGAKGTGAAVASWIGVVLTGISNAYSNLEEQNESGGTMSTGRVVAETISETAIDTVTTYVAAAGLKAVIGAGVATVVGSVAAPVVVTIAAGAALAGLNAGVEYFTGQTMTEWISDAILDTAEDVGSALSSVRESVSNVASTVAESVGDAVSSIGDTVSGWFSSLSFVG